MKLTKALIAFGIYLAMTESVLAFMPGIHKDISGDAMNMITTTVDNNVTIKFTQKAQDEIKKANWDTDVGQGFFVGENHFTEEDFAASSNRLIKLKQDAINEVIGAQPNCELARSYLGTALHTVQDFYSHSNWIERGNNSIFQSLGISTLTDPSPSIAVCGSDPENLPTNGGSILTSAYYSGLGGCKPIQVPGKCYHGNTNPITSGGISCDGIHKDDKSRPYHIQARDLGKVASVKYINEILNDSRVDGNDHAKKCLLGVINGTLGVVVDDTGSMGSEISTVKNQIAAIVSRVKGTNDEPIQYLVERFGDPDVGPPFVTSDSASFLAKVNTLAPSGGGDCPELANTALLQAIGASNRNSSLYVFTDASAKDRFKYLSVISAAALKNIRTTFLLTGSCSPIDPGFIEIAEQTGGQVFSLSTGNLANTFDLVEPQLRDDFVTVFLAKDAIATGTRQYSVPIDSTVSKAVFSASLDLKTSVDLYTPSGVKISTGDPRVISHDLGNSQIYIVDKPMVGNWKLVVTGTGNLSVSVNANSPINFAAFDFVEKVNPIHEALAPIPGNPIVGTSPLVQARMSGSHSSTTFEVIDQNGNTLGSANLGLGNPYAASDEYVGNLTLPVVPFRLLATGVDLNGSVYQRVYPLVFRGQSVRVITDVASTPDSAAIGDTITLNFSVTNLGNTGTFNLSAADNLGLISRLSQTSVNLSNDESASVEVDITIPDDPTIVGKNIVLTLTAVSASDPAITNSTALDIRIIDKAVNQAPVANAGSDNSYSLNEMVTLDGSTSTDPDNAPLPLTYSWAQAGGPSVSLQGADTSSPSFTPTEVGLYTFALTVSDGDLSSSDSVTISVVYDFAGFFSPVENLDAWNAVKAGSSVPIKFSLNGDQGLSVINGGNPSSRQIACDNSSTSDVVEEAETAGKSGLSYDSLTDVYKYVWKTGKSWAGTCRVIEVTLDDHTIHKALFNFSK